MQLLYFLVVSTALFPWNSCFVFVVVSHPAIGDFKFKSFARPAASQASPFSAASIYIYIYIYIYMTPRAIDNIEAALQPGERTDLVSTNRLGHGWAYQKLANQQALFRAGCKDGCDWLPAYELQPICRGQSGALNSMIIRPHRMTLSLSP